MKAFLFATGEHHNLHPLTAHYPSSMLPVANRPVITYPVELMIRHHFHDIVVGLARQADRIEAYLETGRRWNVTFNYLLQREALGNAGAIRRAQGLLTEPFLLMPGDALVDVDLTALYAFHRAHGGVATAVLAQRTAGASCAPAVQVGPDGRMRAAERHAAPARADGPHALSGTALAYTNVFMFEPEIFDFIPNRTAFECQADLIPRLLASSIPVYGYVMQGYWNPLDSFAGYQAAQEDYLRSLTAPDGEDAGRLRLRHPYVEAGDKADGIWRGPNVTVHPSAQITAPVCIGAGSQIGRHVTLGPNVILGPNSIVDDGASLENSTVLPDTYVGQWVKVQQKLVSGSTVIDIESEISIEMTDRVLFGKAGTGTANALLNNMLERLAALILFVMALPFLVLPALFIWLTGGGSILVRQLRVGRSLTDAHQQGGVWPGVLPLYRLRTRLDNGRPTRMGRWLEQWELHRLPELLNVIRGDLALVGVKPLAEEEAALITDAWQRRRFDCPAGFTGRWYTEAEPESESDALFVADAYQAAMQSPGDSLRQLGKTPRVWWRRCGARRGFVFRKPYAYEKTEAAHTLVDADPLK